MKLQQELEWECAFRVTTQNFILRVSHSIVQGGVSVGKGRFLDSTRNDLLPCILYYAVGQMELDS